MTEEIYKRLASVEQEGAVTQSKLQGHLVSCAEGNKRNERDHAQIKVEVRIAMGVIMSMGGAGLYLMVNFILTNIN